LNLLVFIIKKLFFLFLLFNFNVGSAQIYSLDLFEELFKLENLVLTKFLQVIVISCFNVFSKFNFDLFVEEIIEEKFLIRKLNSYPLEDY